MRTWLLCLWRDMSLCKLLHQFCVLLQAVEPARFELRHSCPATDALHLPPEYRPKWPGILRRQPR
jgi:hypothetical protein